MEAKPYLLEEEDTYEPLDDTDSGEKVPGLGPSHQSTPEVVPGVADLDLDDLSRILLFRVGLILNRFGQCSRHCLCKGCNSVRRNDAVGKRAIEKGGVGSFGRKWVYLCLFCMLLLFIVTSIDKRRRIEAEEDAKKARAEGWSFFFLSFSVV